MTFDPYALARYIDTFFNIDTTEVNNIIFGGIDNSDHPDYCHAYIQSADYKGEPMDDQDLNDLNEDHSEFVHEQLLEWIN